MERSLMAINDICRDVITKLDYTLQPPGFHGDIRAFRLMQSELSAVIDQMGQQSSTDQGLNKVITTAEKLRSAPTHILYLLKDPEANGGNGEVIGLLKAGRKHLFLFDARAHVHEVEPLCVLDFFVRADRQRHGYGRQLFDYMLQDQNVRPHQLAIDGPSPKMEKFLAKNYGMDHLIRQNNNFAISPQFFETPAHLLSKCALTPVAASPVGRFAAHRRTSDIASVIHGGDSTTPFMEHARGAEVPASVEPVLSEEPAQELEQAEEEEVRAEERAETSEPPAEVESVPRPRFLPVSTGAAPAGMPSAGATPHERRDSQLTDRGFFDVKFYHNKLW